MIDKLEEIKKIGAYAISIFYGEEVGCDDLNIPSMERNIQVIYNPVGYLGEVRCLWKGKLKDFLTFDFKNTKPTKISNPPQNYEYKDAGFYAWGTNSSIDDYLNKSIWDFWE